MNIYPLEPLIDTFRLYAAQYLWELEEWKFAYLAMGLWTVELSF